MSMHNHYILIHFLTHISFSDHFHLSGVSLHANTLSQFDFSTSLEALDHFNQLCIVGLMEFIFFKDHTLFQGEIIECD